MPKNNEKTWIFDQDNVEFTELIARLSNLGVPQQEVAGILGVSAGQVSRVKKGERHASVKHLRKLRRHVQRLAEERSLEPVFAPPAMRRATNRTVEPAVARNLILLLAESRMV